MAVFDAPRGTGPYGITTTPEGRVFFASLAGNYLGRHRYRDRHHHGFGAARAAARRTARLERQPRRTVDYRLEQRRSLPLRQQERSPATYSTGGSRPNAPYSGRERRRMGVTLDAAPAQAWPGRI